MTYQQASRLHNGDEVISKTTGESIRVLSIEGVNCQKLALPPGKGMIQIEGVGTQSGYFHWLHDEVT